MIVTEEEAKTKRCQETYGPTQYATVTVAVPLNPFGHQINQPAFPAMPTNCIGSACMAWRIAEPATDGSPGEEYGREKRPEGDKIYYVAGTEKPPSPAKGFCGKAGKP